MFTVLEMSNTSRPKAEPKYVTYDYFQQQLKSIDNAAKQYTRNYINNTVASIQSNVVNYSALSNQSKSLTDGVRTIDFDSITQSIQFRTNINQTTNPIKIHPITNTINNVSKINFNDTSTITGITSDSSNTDPTKAISANILTGINSRFTALETKTQNQTATENETTFTGNITANTFNGYNLKAVGNYHKLPEIVVINERSVVEIGRNLDFHDNTSTSVDYDGRISYKQNYFHCSDTFVVENGKDLKANNIISSKGNLNNIIDRTVALETKDTEQDTRLDTIETKNTEQDTRLSAIETKNTEQDTRLSAIETKNTEQDTRLDTIETKTQNQSATANQTTFTGNITADTFNGYHLGFNNRFYTLPAIPFINSDLVMEVGRYIDFHYNNSTGTDNTARLSVTKPGNLHFDHSFILDKGSDFRARNLISDNGDLNNIIDRTVALETKNTEQDTRLSAIETNNTEQDTRLTNIETKNTEQDTRLSAIETNNTEQDTRLTNIETKNTEQDTRLTNIESKNTEQDTRLTNIESKNTEQDESLDELYKNKLYVTYEGGTVAPDIIRELIPELSEQITVTFNIKITMVFEDNTRIPTLPDGFNRLIRFVITYYAAERGKPKLIQNENIITYKNEGGSVTWYPSAGYTMKNAIIEKGKISLDMSYKHYNQEEPEMWHGSFDGSIYYYSGAVLTQPTINEYFISKNLAYDNEERLTAATNKNTEQDTRLTNIETKNTEQDEKLDNIINEGEKYINDKTLSLVINNVQKEEGADYPITNEYHFQLNPVSNDIYLKAGPHAQLYLIITWIKHDESGVAYGQSYEEIYVSYDGNNVTVNAIEFTQPSFDIETKTLIVPYPTGYNYTLRTYEYTEAALKELYCYHSYVIAPPFSNNIIDLIYPVGSIYLTFNQSPPIFGTWELLTDDYFLMSTTTSPGETGGSDSHSHQTADHTLTIDEMPSHTHPLKGYGQKLASGSSGYRFGSGGSNVTDDTMLSTGGNQPHNHGNTLKASNIPPYIKCYMYKRTA